MCFKEIGGSSTKACLMLFMLKVYMYEDEPRWLVCGIFIYFLFLYHIREYTENAWMEYIKLINLPLKR